MNSGHEVQLPQPDQKAYFPESGTSEILSREAIRRAGDNLVYAIEYGSQVTGDASPTSKHDMILIVENTRKFHERNLSLSASDYGRPRSAGFHTFLNRFGFNFYQTTIPIEEGPAMAVKYAVISREDFIKGCNGSLEEKEKDGRGAFGLYVAGRMQKAALRPLAKDGDDKVAQIEEAINTARIDGVWLALGLQGPDFSLDQLISSYVSLSYRADLRVEKPNKIQILIDRSKNEYEEMLQPILDKFIEQGLVARSEDDTYQKVQSMSLEEVERRLRQIRVKTALVNYIKNPLTSGIGESAKYALDKVRRSLRR